MVNTFYVMLLTLILSFPSSANAESTDDNDVLESLYGIYAVENIERYRGGLTSREEASLLVDRLVTIKPSELLFWDGAVCANPVYEINSHVGINSEGHIPSATEKYGNFYGYGIEREVIRTLSVNCQQSSEVSYLFEVVGDELWVFLDGWLYRLEKTSIDGSSLSLKGNSGIRLRIETTG